MDFVLEKRKRALVYDFVSVIVLSELVFVITIKLNFVIQQDAREVLRRLLHPGIFAITSKGAEWDVRGSFNKNGRYLGILM